MEYNPEAFASVIMLYVDCEVNGVEVKAFVDSGAQSTIMSQICAQRLGLMRLIDRSWISTSKLSPFNYHFLAAIFFQFASRVSICVCCSAKTTAIFFF